MPPHAVLQHHPQLGGSGKVRRGVVAGLLPEVLVLLGRGEPQVHGRHLVLVRGIQPAQVLVDLLHQLGLGGTFALRLFAHAHLGEPAQPLGLVFL